MWKAVGHCASAVAVRGGGKGPCQILVIRKETKQMSSVWSQWQAFLALSSSQRGPPSQLPSLPALTAGASLHCPGHMERKVSVTSELERPRREQSTARVGPVNTAVFEGWCGKLYVPMKMLGIQIRIISTGSFCVLMHFYKLAVRTQFSKRPAWAEWYKRHAGHLSRLQCVHMYHKNTPQFFLLTRFIWNCLWGNLGCLAMMFVLLNYKCWARTLQCPWRKGHIWKPNTYCLILARAMAQSVHLDCSHFSCTRKDS